MGAVPCFSALVTSSLTTSEATSSGSATFQSRQHVRVNSRASPTAVASWRRSSRRTTSTAHLPDLLSVFPSTRTATPGRSALLSHKSTKSGSQDIPLPLLLHPGAARGPHRLSPRRVLQQG